VLFTMLGSLLMLVAMLYLVGAARAHLGHLSFDLADLYQVPLTPTEARWLFAGFAIAFAIKVPMWPVHTWLPDAHTEAPTAGSVILAGVMLKMGTYGFLRFAIPLFPGAAVEAAPLFMALAVIGIIYGALVAMVQPDLKRLIAYSSVSHLGFVMLGIFALDQQGVEGAIYQMIGHGLSTGALFLLVGIIYLRRHTREIAEFGGLWKSVPIYAAVFMFVMLSSIGLPGLNGFVGEFLVLIGTFVAHRWWAVVATTGVVIAAVYLLWAYQQAFHGEPSPEDIKTRDLGWNERLIVAPLIVLIVALGVYPKPVLDRITPSVNQLVVHVDRVTNTAVPANLLTPTAARPDRPHPAASSLAASSARRAGGSGSAGGTR
jgi:NADH-quinone oxidoreductase subunit M